MSGLLARLLCRHRVHVVHNYRVRTVRRCFYCGRILEAGYR
jgi:hypothetical protein